MKLAVKTCLLLLVFSLAVMAVPSAFAQCPPYDLGVGSAWGYYGGGGFYGWVNRKIPPYFAIHPPVYYSDIVPRPYGYSPNALPPGVEPAEMKVAPQPEQISNPYYKPQPQSDDAVASTPDRTAATGVMVNPYYQTGQPAAGRQWTSVR